MSEVDFTELSQPDDKMRGLVKALPDDSSVSLSNDPVTVESVMRAARIGLVEMRVRLTDAGRGLKAKR